MFDFVMLYWIMRYVNCNVVKLVTRRWIGEGKKNRNSGIVTRLRRVTIRVTIHKIIKNTFIIHEMVAKHNII